jgi:hypothetical protein
MTLRACGWLLRRPLRSPGQNGHPAKESIRTLVDCIANRIAVGAARAGEPLSFLAPHRRSVIQLAETGKWKLETRNSKLVIEAQEHPVGCIKLFSIFEFRFSGFHFPVSTSCFPCFSVNHSREEYARREPDGRLVTTNTVERFFSLIKRGVYGTFHHISGQHLHRYPNEFDFRYNARETTDGERALLAISGFKGKRLTYRTRLGEQN